MLNNRDNHEQAKAVAQQVTSESLLRALAAIDARKAKEAAAKDGTVAVGEALTQIGAQDSAEEVYAEILRHRATETAAATAQSPKPRRLSPLMFVAFALAATGGIVGVMHHSRMNPPMPAPIISMPFAPSVPASDYDVKDIAQIPDEMTFFCQYSDVQKILQRQPLAKIKMVSLSADPYPPWIMVKHDGIPYLHGWISKSFVSSPLSHGNVLIYCAPPDAPIKMGLVGVTLNCYALQPRGFYIQMPDLSSPKKLPAEMLVAANVHLDKYAGESW